MGEHLQPNTESGPFSKEPAHFLEFTTKNPQEQNALPVIMQHALYMVTMWLGAYYNAGSNWTTLLIGVET